MEKEIQYVIKYLHNFLSAVSDASLRNPPPGANAANGVWVMQMANEIYNEYYEKGNDQILNGVITQGTDASKLWGVYANFVTGNLNPFKNHLTYEGSFVDTVKINRAAIIAGAEVLVDVITIVASSGNNSHQDNDRSKQKAQQELAEDIAKFMSLLNDDNTSKGNHANGFIASDYHNQVNNLKSIYLERFQGGLTTKEGNILKVILIELINRLSGQPLENYKPWLNANWQGLYTTKILGGKKAIEYYFNDVAQWDLSKIIDDIKQEKEHSFTAPAAETTI